MKIEMAQIKTILQLPDNSIANAEFTYNVLVDC